MNACDCASSCPSRDTRIDPRVLIDRLVRHASAETTGQVHLRDWNASIAHRPAAVRLDDPRRDARRNERDVNRLMHGLNTYGDHRP